MDTSPSRLFPPIERRLYEDPSSADGSVSPDQELARGVLELSRRRLSSFQRLTGAGLDEPGQVTRLLRYHRLALETELQGESARADFYWRQAHAQLTRLAGRLEVWRAAMAALSAAPDAPLREEPERLARAVAGQVFADTHRSFLRGYFEAAGQPAAGDRAFVHLEYARRAIQLAGWSDEAAMAALGPGTLAEIEACQRAEAWARAQDLAGALLRRFPEETAYQSALAEAYAAEAKGKLTNRDGEAHCLRDATTLARSIFRIKKLRREYPHNPNLFESIAWLHLLRAQRLAAAGRLAEALVDALAAVTFQPDLTEAAELRSDLEAKVQSLRVQMAAPEEERPALSKRELARLADQAAKGFRLMDDYRRSEEARAIEEDLPVARGRRVWEEARLGPLERIDYRPLALQDAFDAIRHQPPADPAGIPAAWHWVSQDNPHLASLDAPRAHTCLQKILFGTAQEAREVPGPSEPADAPPPLAASPPRRSSEPFLAWLLSGESKWLKVQCLAALILVIAGGRLAMREHSHREIRTAAWQEIRAAREHGDYPRMIDSAERFLGHPVIGRDARTSEVESLYSEALVRWFGQELPSPGQSGPRIERYRQLLGLKAG